MPPPSDFQAKLEGQRAYLMRYATLQLRDADRAEDCVQETLLAALAGEAGFGGRSDLRTWLTGILKHKIVDAIRRSSREPAMAFEPEGEGSDFDTLFDPRPLGRGPLGLGAPGRRPREVPVPRRARSLPRAAAGKDRASVHDARAHGARNRGNL